MDPDEELDSLWKSILASGGAAKIPAAMKEWERYIDPVSGEMFLQDPETGRWVKLNPPKAQEDKPPILRETDAGVARYNTDTGRLEPVPGGENMPKDPTRPPEPSVNTSAQRIPVWNEAAKTWEWQDNPNYVAPTPPAGRKPSSETMAEQVQASQLRREEVMEQAKAALWEAQEAVRLGIKTTPQIQHELDAKLARLKLDLDNDAAYQRALLAEEAASTRQASQIEATADLETGRQQFEGRYRDAEAARATEQLGMQKQQLQFGQNQARAGVLMKQAETGHGLLTQGVQAGVAPSPEVVRSAYWDPFARAMDIMNQGIKEGWIDPAWKPVRLPPLAGNGPAPVLPPPA